MIKRIRIHNNKRYLVKVIVIDCQQVIDLFKRQKMMRRYFYTSGPLLSQWIQKNTMLKKLQDNYFRNAMLAAKYLNPQQSFQKLYENIIEMTITEQNKYANNFHLQSLFKQFSTLNRSSKLKNMVIDTSKSNVKDLVDPDKFPIWDNRMAKPIYSQLWGWVMGKIRHSLGFQLVVRDSKVQHPSGGRGVKVIFSNNFTTIQPGQFIGFVPGTIYENYNTYKKYRVDRLGKYEKRPEHLHFASGKILELGDIPLGRYDFEKDKIKENEERLSNTLVDPSFINPYALGHMINHPPPGEEENVCFAQIYVQKKFFPSYYLRYIPYVNSYDASQKHLRLFGIFALKQIKNNQQLFVNYLQNHIYPIDNIPQWYLKPTRLSQHYKFFQKGEYELPTRTYWTWLENKYMERNKQLYQKFKQQTSFQPGNIMYQDSEKTIRKMSLKPYQKDNEFQ